MILVRRTTNLSPKMCEKMDKRIDRAHIRLI